MNTEAHFTTPQLRGLESSMDFLSNLTNPARVVIRVTDAPEKDTLMEELVRVNARRLELIKAITA